MGEKRKYKKVKRKKPTLKNELNSERIILRITSFPAACGGVSERIKITIFLNSRRFSATCCGELQLRYLVLITFVCLILAFVLAFITGKVPSFLDRTIQRQADRIVVERVKDVEKEMLEKVKKENLEDVVKEHKD